MNEKAKTLFKNLNYTVFANLLVLSTSILLNLIVPKFIGLKEYSFWQLYIFYSGYVGFFHFGWIDGIYLKIGGERYEDLDKKNLGSQFFYLFILQMILGFLLFNFSLFFVSDINKKVILILTSFLLVILNLKTFTMFILQSTNRIKEYARLSVNDRYFYIILAIGYLWLGGKKFVVLVILDVLSKLIMTIYGIFIVHDIVFQNKLLPFKKVSKDIKNNIHIGSNLMLGSIASMLILGISRLFVERNWDIETFGQLSFALSISNMFMLFISAISVVLYPILRRTNQDSLPKLYINVRNLFVPFALCLLLLFNPVKIILEWWLPEYKSSLFFMGILFPMIFYEGRISLLVNTYLKTIRQEKIILLSNIFTLVVSVISAYISVYIFNNINLTVFSIILVLGFRCILSETLLLKILNINITNKNTIETIMIIIFIISNILFQSFISFIIYLIVLIIYFILNYDEIKKAINYFLILIKKQKNDI